jgi:FkbM family methyltransferase
VYSLEADPFYVELQNSTIKSLPSGYAPVTPLCAAASDQLGVLDLSLPRRGHTRNHLTIVEGNDAGETESHKCVVSVTADFLLQYWPKPDFVKVDIEGSELLFLRGATKLLSEARPTLYIEVSELNSSAASKVLSSFDYGLFTLLPDGSEVREESCKFNSLARPLEET